MSRPALLNLKKTCRYRVGATTAIRATATRTLRFASTYTRSVSDALAVAVDCYAGARGDETPRRFTFENQLVEIRTVVDQWRTPDHRYFRVRTAASESYTLRHAVG